MKLAGDPVQLQRLSITIPKGHDLAGLSFVLRSGDRSMWWRDGTLPIVPCLPSVSHPGVQSAS